MIDSIKKIVKNYPNNEKIVIKGWIVSNRGNKKIRFINLNDGSTVKNIQIVFNELNFDLEEIEKWKIGSALEVQGIFKLTPNAKQNCEIEALSAKNMAIWRFTCSLLWLK